MLSRDETAKGWHDQGFTAEEAARLSAELGWSPIETIKALNEHFGVRIGDAERLVMTPDEPTRIASEYGSLQALLVAKMPASATEDDLEELEADGWNNKLFGLVRAGCHDDALAAIERFEPSTMRFRPLSLADARQLVEAEISAMGIELQLLEDATLEHGFGWTFCYQSAAYLSSGDFRDALGGNAPLLVDRTTGALWFTGTAFELDHYVRNYLATGDPHVAPEDETVRNKPVIASRTRRSRSLAGRKTRSGRGMRH